MSHELVRAFMIALAVTLTGPAEALAQTETRPLALAEGASLQAVLETKVDARRAAVGDAISARTTQSVEAQTDTAVTIPRGSKLRGRITQVSAAILPPRGQLKRLSYGGSEFRCVPSLDR